MSDAIQAIEPELIEKMNAIASALDAVFNPGLKGKDKKIGFVVLSFRFGLPDRDSRCNFISNSNRDDVLATMKEFIARAEGRVVETETSQ